MPELARAGELKDRISIEMNSRTRSAGGLFTDGWAEFTRCWAIIEPGGGREFYGDREVTSESLITIIIRFQRGITTKMRVRYDDPKTGNTRYFNIRNLTTAGERRTWITMRVAEYNEGEERVN